jgi:hypothetical protein
MAAIDITEILKKVLAASIAKKVEWTTTTLDSVFKANLGTYFIYSSKSPRGIFAFVINDSAGVELGTTSDSLDNTDVALLWNEARKIALQLEKSLNDLNNLLDTLK